MPQSLLPSRYLIQRRPAALEAIRRHFCDFGCSPSFAEISARIGVPVRHVSEIVRSLVSAGHISHVPGEARSIRLPDPTEMLSNSELVRTLQSRGLLVMVLPNDARDRSASAVASAWPEVTVVKVELSENDRFDDLLHQLGGDDHGQGHESA